MCVTFFFGMGCVRQCREHVVGVLKEAVHSLARLMEAKVWFSEARDRVSVGMCLHAFFSLRNEGLIVMNTTFLANLLKISRDISSCSMLSLAPVDMQAPGNTMAEAILAIMDPFASPQRAAFTTAVESAERTAVTTALAPSFAAALAPIVVTAMVML